MDSSTPKNECTTENITFEMNESTKQSEAVQPEHIDSPALISSVSNVSNSNSILTPSSTSEKTPEELEEIEKAKAVAIARHQEMLQIKRREIIALVCRQTPYSEEEAEAKLIETHGDYLRVIREAVKRQSQSHYDRDDVFKRPHPTSTNQKIYSQIRNFMDTATKKYEIVKKQTELYNEFIEKQKQTHSQTQSDSQNVISSNKDETL